VSIRNREVHLGVIAWLIILVLLSSALATLYYTKLIDHQATIVSDGKIQAYSDAGFTMALDSHGWGDFNVSVGDDTKTLDVYLRNEGNVAVNVTWRAVGFTSYNDVTFHYESSSWEFYLVKVDGGVTVKPDNDTSPTKMLLNPNESVQLKFYLTAISGSAPEELSFQTKFFSQDI
jgi:hypothetical protein